MFIDLEEEGTSPDDTKSSLTNNDGLSKLISSLTFSSYGRYRHPPPCPILPPAFPSPKLNNTRTATPSSSDSVTADFSFLSRGLSLAPSCANHPDATSSSLSYVIEKITRSIPLSDSCHRPVVGPTTGQEIFAGKSLSPYFV